MRLLTICIASCAFALGFAVPANAQQPEVAAAAVEPAAPAAAVASAPAGSTLDVSGYVQVDWVAHDEASVAQVDWSRQAPLNQERFLLRRGRLRVEHTKGWFGAALEVDANTVAGAQVRPVNAEVSASWPATRAAAMPGLAQDLQLSASAGLIKIPFGLEVPERELQRPWLERSTLARALFPGAYDLGVCLHARFRYLKFAIAALNGHPIGDRVFPALGPNPTKELVGRLGGDFPLWPSARVGFGISADAGQGFHEGSPATKDQLAWRDDNGDGLVSATEVQVLAGSSATPSSQYSRFGLGADAQLQWQLSPLGTLRLRAEVVRAKNLDRGLEHADPVAAGYALREFGWYAGAAQELGSWGLAALRFDSYDPDQDAHERRVEQVVVTDRTYRTLGLLFALRHEQGKLALEYARQWNALGRASNGAPTTLASGTLTARAEVVF